MAAEDLTIRAHLINEVSGPAQTARRDVRALADETTRSNATQAAAAAAHRKQSEAVGDLHKRILGLSGTLGGALSSGLKLATIGIVGIGGVAAVMGLKAASSFQMTRVAFDTMLGSVEAGGALFKQLQALNLKSPFELSQITQATQVLLRYGVAGDSVVAITKGIADAASLSGPRMVENLDRISLALGQVQAKGKLQGEEARQLAEAGIDAYGVYQRTLGLTRAQVEKLGEAGKLQAAVLLDAVAREDLGIAGLSSAAEKLSQTLGGQFSNIKDLLNVGLADAAQPLVKQLGTLIGTPDQPGALVSGLQSLVTVVGPPLFTLVGTFADLLAKGLPALEPILSAIAGGAGQLLVAAQPALAALGPVADDLALSLGGLFAALVPVMPDLVRAFVALVAVLPTFVDLLAKIIPLVAPILSLFAGFLELGPVNTALAITLGVLLGYRALSSVIGLVKDMANALHLTAIATDETTAANARSGGIGAGNAAALGVSALGAGVLLDASRRKPSTGTTAEAALGGAITGGGIGFMVGGPVGAAIGAGAGGFLAGAFALGRQQHGDTPSSKNLANTLAGHRFANAMTGGGAQITNALGATYAGSDHRAGRALDLIGPNLQAYAQIVRGAGGYADMHGSHLHAVMGDTPSSRSTARPGPGGVAVLVDVHHNVITSDVDLERAITRAVPAAIRRDKRDRKERD